MQPARSMPTLIRRDDHAAADADDVVQVVALEAVDDAAEDAERKAQRHVDADDQHQRAAGRHLVRCQREEAADVERDEHEHRVRDQAEDAEDDEQRAGNLVQAAGIALGAVMGDEPDDRAAESQVEDREVGGHRRRQHPEAVGRRSEVVDVEGEQHQADEGIGRDGEIAGRDVARHGDELAIVAPDRVVLVHRPRHLAPFPNRITLTVSSTIVRSKTIDRCLM